MSLAQQFKLLMWKNFAIRRRQKLRSFVEVLWPLSLFVLLMLVRSKGLYLRVHQCHFEDKPLPSAGQFLFWQGLVCSFNNTCYPRRKDAERNYSDIYSSDISLLLNDAQAFTEMTMHRSGGQFEKLIADIDSLSQAYFETQEYERNSTSNKTMGGSKLTTIEDQIEKYDNADSQLNPKLSKLIETHQKINVTLNELEPYLEITSLLKRINVSYENITNIIKNVPEVNDIFVRLHKFMCGNSSDTTIEMMLEPGHSVNNLRGYLNSIQDTPATIEYQYDNDTSKECNAVYEHLETSPHLKFVWRFLKPFVRGKIVYAPNTTVIRRVMSRIKSYTNSPKFSSFKKEQRNLKEDYKMYNGTLEKLNDLLKFYENQNRTGSALSNLLKDAFESPIQKSYNFLKTYQEDMNDLSTEKLTNIGRQLSEILKCYTSITIEHFNTEEEAEQRSMQLCEKNELLAQITFDNTQKEKLDSFVRYKIRMNAERINYLSMFSLNNGPNYKPFEDLKLITFGFIYLQDMVERSIIQEHTNRTDTPGYVMKQLPHPCFVEDWFLSSLGGMFPMFMVLSWVYTASMIIKSIVYEKEQKLQETMRALGMNDGIHWCSWFFDSIIPMVITVFVLSTVLVYGGVVANAEYTLVVSFLLCYAVSTITMCFLVSVFFSKANLAASSGGIIFFMTYLPFPLIDAWFPLVSPVFKEIGSLLSNVALGMGSKYFALRELEGTGAKWSNVATSPLAGDRFSISKIMFIFIIDALLYFILAWYIGNVYPGNYGIPKNWYFPFTMSYWFPIARQLEDEPVGSEKETVSQDSSTIEEDPIHLEKGVAIKKMTKIYKDGKVAINELSLNFYQDQITAFLGTNGAGKTTTISILTGLFPPTSGTATIYGLNVRYQMNIIRRSLGICPQYNILFHDLTVQEHLWFFARLKGHTLGEVQVEIQTILTDLGLHNKKDTFAKHLSGGMKRKLSIAIAFIGKSRTVVLDEPTAGVDPYSRMGIWNLLLKYKRGRTIILTTHNMAEADLLGDRIAIVDAGKLVCCGSNSFLKSKLGWGYVLTVDLNLEYKLPESIDVFHNDLIDGIIKIIPGSKVIEKFGTEIKVNLPPVKDNIKLYENLFEYLLENKEKYGISSFGFSDTSLEEIFLKLTNENEKLDDISKEESNQSMKDEKYGAGADYETHEDENKRANLFSQLKALLLKRMWRNRRNRMEIAIQLLLPAILVGVCMSITSNLVLIRQPDPIVADIARCPRSVSLDTPPACTSFYQKLSSTSKKTQNYIDVLRDSIGFGNRCLNDTNIVKKCKKAFVIPEVESKQNHSMENCSCTKGRFACEFNGSLGHPEMLVTASGFRFYNLTGKDIEDWVLTTFETTDDFEKQVTKKTGGFSFGLKLLMKGRNLSTQFNSGEAAKKLNSFLSKPPTRLAAAWFNESANVGGLFHANETSVTKLKQFANLSTIEKVNAAFNGGQYENLNPPMDPIQEGNRTKNLSRVNNNSNLSTAEEALGTANISGKQNQSSSDPNVDDNIKIWFNNKWSLSPVVYLNGINNLILRALMPSNVSRNYGIQVTMQGMNLTIKQMQTKLSQKATSSLLHSICLLFSLSFVPASFSIYLIEERVSGCKHLQLISGVNWAVYWIHAYLWDLVCHSLSGLICIVPLLCFQEEAYIGACSLPSLTLLVLLFGWSNIPLMYPATFFFQVPSSAFVALASFNISIGVLTTASTYVLRLFEDEYLRGMRTLLSNIFLICPHFCLGDGLMKLSESYFLTTALAGFDVKFKVNLLAWNYLGKNLTFMFVEGIFFFLAVLCYERFQRSVGFCTEQPMSLEPPTNLDEDVESERKRILNLAGDKEVLVMKCLTKVYKSRKHIAVNQLCLGVDKGQCFGLIGLNGAGKTSTFKMLTGDTDITFGDATVLGHSVRDHLTSVRSRIGYCPQFDALDSKLTPAEHLRLYASLRNIPKDRIPETVNSSLRRFDLWRYRNICSRYLSGGNKRKLSTAIAMVGDPQLIFLDEPTCGMDPKARRFLWSRIKDCVARGRAVVMTSHSMSECEALCSRLSIMVNGQFMCLGSVQHLKNKFGRGYNLVVRAPLENIALVKKLISERMPEAIEKSEHYTQVKYHVNVETFSLFNILTILEEAREDELILDYSMSQTSLGEVFLHFVSHQAVAKQPESMSRWDCCRLLCCEHGYLIIKEGELDDFSKCCSMISHSMPEKG